MKPERRAQELFGWTRAKAKMYEFRVPDASHIRMYRSPTDLFSLAVGVLGDLASEINRNGVASERVIELRDTQLFPARFFDAFVKTRIETDLVPYLMLLSAASYYLGQLPGSSMVLSRMIGEKCPDMGASGLEDLVLWLLHANTGEWFEGNEGTYGEYLDAISQSLVKFYETGSTERELTTRLLGLRKLAYEGGSSRELLLADVICALTRARIENSSWYCLPRYSGQNPDTWSATIAKEGFLRELWPAQHLLGKAGVFAGKSAVIQMPTSAGKTRATELLIRCSFLAGRASLAVIVAPFRALCHEIRADLEERFRGESVRVDELPDSLQLDFDFEDLLGGQQIVVVTPEKLLYVLRQNPDIAQSVGLVVFDEGHQFDSGNRGITYELLLTSLNMMLNTETQKVLISAVVSNAASLSNWLFGSESVVQGSNLSPTLRSIGFASWGKTLGEVDYVKADQTEEIDFYVPRVIEPLTLKRKKGESKTRVRLFPDKNGNVVGKEVALYLGLRLVSEGPVAIFCGRKDTAANLCEMLAERFSRDLEMSSPAEQGDQSEVKLLSELIASNLGEQASAFSSAKLGVFPHHASVPHGVRLAVENAMREGDIRFVICTSTLAQGVNLPIRYLIVTSIYQGEEAIKVRDFHNLIGRVGRAGMHTEGSVIFSDLNVFDQRKDRDEAWRWKRVQELLDPAKSEACVSSLLKLIPLKLNNDRSAARDKRMHELNWSISDFAKYYVAGSASLGGLITQIAHAHRENGFTEKVLKKQFDSMASTLAAIESFLMASWDSGDTALDVEDAVRLAEGTLAYFLGNSEQRDGLRELFQTLALNLSQVVIEPERRRSYGRTLLGVNEVKQIENWVSENSGNMLASADAFELLEVLWGLLPNYMKNGACGKMAPPRVLKTIGQCWIRGDSFDSVLGEVIKAGGKMAWGENFRDFKIEHIVEICENGLAFDGGLIVGAVAEAIQLGGFDPDNELLPRLRSLQKSLKYGVRGRAAISLYELGFADRVVIGRILEDFGFGEEGRSKIVEIFRSMPDEAAKAVSRFPRYFREIMSEIVTE